MRKIYIFSGILWVLSLSFWGVDYWLYQRTVHAGRAEDRASVILLDYGTQGVTPVVAFADNEQCDDAIVQTFYHVETTIGPLVRSQTSVVPCVSRGRVAADIVPASKANVTWVDLKFMRQIAGERHKTFEDQ